MPEVITLAKKKIETPEIMEEKWEEFKKYCDEQTVLTHDFSAKNSEFVSKELRRSITYTLEGFCVFVKIPRRTFYDTYADNKRFSHIVTRMREECEIDARRKFELGMIEPRLAGLWMSKHGYSTKVENQTTNPSDGVLPTLLEYLKHGNDKGSD